jgi:hypothetical protein
MVDAAAMEGASVGWQCTSMRCARTSDAGNMIWFSMSGEQLVTVIYQDTVLVQECWMTTRRGTGNVGLRMVAWKCLCC